VFPNARVAPIGTSARVGGATGCDVEAMEGYAVLRAANLAGIPAVEIRATANAIGEPDRSKWRFEEAKALMAESIPLLLREVVGA
jgi:nucleoside phosphorylase